MEISINSSRSRRVSFEPGEIHVWSVPLNARQRELEILSRALSAEERRRAARFRFDADRVEFVTARGVLRFLLSAYVGDRPEDLTFDQNPFGKPFLRRTERTVAFNVAHRKGRALFAVRKDGEIGVDIECKRRLVDFLEIARDHLLPEEFNHVASAPERSRYQLFLRYWTLKEAVVKATGLGVRQLNEFRINLSAGEAISPEWLTKDSGAAVSWYVRSLDLARGYLGAVAAPGMVRRLDLRTSSLRKITSLCKQGLRLDNGHADRCDSQE